MTVAVLAAVVAAVYASVAGDKPVTTDRFYLTSTAGSVLFDHAKHNEGADSCATCHHDLISSRQAVSCEKCHGDEFDPADFEHSELKEFHDRECFTCHEQTADDEQAASCRSCHPGRQENETRTLDCTQCHDDDYEPEMMGHDEFLEIEDHSCLGCHTPGSVSEAYHTNCTACHLQAVPERFTNDDDTVKCSGCHLR